MSSSLDLSVLANARTKVETLQICFMESLTKSRSIQIELGLARAELEVLETRQARQAKAARSLELMDIEWGLERVAKTDDDETDTVFEPRLESLVRYLTDRDRSNSEFRLLLRWTAQDGDLVELYPLLEGRSARWPAPCVKAEWKAFCLAYPDTVEFLKTTECRRLADNAREESRLRAAKQRVYKHGNQYFVSREGERDYPAASFDSAILYALELVDMEDSK